MRCLLKRIIIDIAGERGGKPKLITVENHNNYSLIMGTGMREMTVIMKCRNDAN